MLSSWRLYFVWKYESRLNLNLMTPTISVKQYNLHWSQPHLGFPQSWRHSRLLSFEAPPENLFAKAPKGKEMRNLVQERDGGFSRGQIEENPRARDFFQALPSIREDQDSSIFFNLPWDLFQGQPGDGEKHVDGDLPVRDEEDAGGPQCVCLVLDVPQKVCIGTPPAWIKIFALPVVWLTWCGSFGWELWQQGELNREGAVASELAAASR